MPVRLLPEYSALGNGFHIVRPCMRLPSASVAAFGDFLFAEMSELWGSA